MNAYDFFSASLDASALANSINFHQNLMLARPLISLGIPEFKFTLGGGAGQASRGSAKSKSKAFVKNIFFGVEAQPTNNLKILAEFSLILDDDMVLRSGEDSVSYAVYGFRFFDKNTSVDVGMFVPSDDMLGKYALGIPLIAFSHRFDGDESP